MPDHIGCPECCCILEICCPPGGEPLAALTRQLVADTGGDEEIARMYAAAIFARFDLAPRGSLGPFKRQIAAMARKDK